MSDPGHATPTVGPDPAAALRLEQHARWRAGDRVPVEVLLGRDAAVPIDAETAIVLIYGEYLLRRDLGEAPTLDEYLDRFPQHARRLRQQDAIHCLLDGEPADAAPPGGPHIPGYSILGELGRGAMGRVYEARQHALNRIVALKVLNDQATADPEALARFRTEAEALARLSDAQIVTVYDFGEHDGRAYLAVERVEGGSLDRRLDGTPWPPRRAADLVASLAQAIELAHRHEVVHRDLKPANILLTADGVPKISDFGLARLLDQDGSATRTGTVLGTPSYMAPEQASGARVEVGPAADVYSLGAILYELLTGRPPFRAATPLETLVLVRDHDPVPPRRLQPGLPRDLETICLRAMDKQPRRRYASARALAEDLGSWQADEPIRARRIGRAERLWKWARRRPAIAALGGFLLIVVAVSSIGLLVLYGQAVVARATALEALGRSEVSLYANRIALAERYRQAHDADRADELLDECPVPLRDWEWRYLKRRSVEDVRVETDHDADVLAVAFSRDGRFLVSVDGGRNIHVRDRATCRLLVLPGIPGVNWALALSPDGRWMAVGGHHGDLKKGAIRLFSTQTWTEVKSLSGVGESAKALAFSPDGRRLVSGHFDDKVRVWDVGTGAVRTLSGHKNMIEDVAVSPDGRLVASASRDTTIRIWDAETGELRMTLPHERWVYGVAFHPQGRLLASSTGNVVDSSRGDLTLWDLASARAVRKTSALAQMIHKIGFSPNGRRLATAGWDGVVRIWDTTTLNELLALTGHIPHVLCVAFSPDGHQLVTGGGAGMIRCWDAAPLPERPSHRPMRTFSGHEQPINRLALMPDGHQLISIGEDRTARVWDVETGQQSLCYRGHEQAPFALAVRPDGQAIATGGNEQVIRIWDARTGADLRQLRGHTGTITSLTFHPDGIWLASASQDGTVRLWDTRTGDPIHQFLQAPYWLFAVAFSPDGHQLAAAGDSHGVRVWDVGSRQLRHVLHGHSQRVVALAFHPDSDRLLSASLDGTVRLWELSSGREVRVFDGVRGRGLAWTSDGRHFAVSGGGGALKVWETVSGRRILTLQGHADDITSAAFASDGRRIFTASWDGTMRLWEATPDAPDLSMGEDRRLVGHTREAPRLAVLPDGKRVVSSGRDGTIRVWDLADGRELRRWTGSGGFIGGLAVTPDCKRVVTAGEFTEIIQVFEIESGREVQRFPRPQGVILALAVTPDGRRVLSGGPIPKTPSGGKAGPDRDLHLWDLDTGKEVRRFAGHRDGITCLAISPDGRRAVSGSTDGTVRIWDIDAGAEIRCIDAHPRFWVNVLSFLPDGRRVLSGGTDYHLRLWDLEGGAEIRRFDGPRVPIDGLAIAPDGRHALSSGLLDSHLRLWNLDTGHEVYRYEVPQIRLTSGAFTRDGRQAIWAAYDGVLRIWDIPEHFTTAPSSSSTGVGHALGAEVRLHR
jgi:WD40 repeat protein